MSTPALLGHYNSLQHPISNGVMASHDVAPSTDGESSKLVGCPGMGVGGCSQHGCGSLNVGLITVVWLTHLACRLGCKP